MKHIFTGKADKRFSRKLLAASVFLAFGGHPALSVAASASPETAPDAAEPSSSSPTRMPKAKASTVIGKFFKDRKFTPDEHGILTNIAFTLPSTAAEKVAFNFFESGVSRRGGPRKQGTLIAGKYLIRINQPGYISLSKAIPVDSATRIIIGEMDFNDAKLQGSVLNNNNCILYQGCSNIFRLSLKDSSLTGDLLLNASEARVKYYPTGTKEEEVSLRVTLDNAVLTGASGRADVELITPGDPNSVDGQLHAGSSDIQLTLSNSSTWNVRNHTQQGFNFSTKDEYKSAQQAVDRDTSTAYPKPTLEKLQAALNKKIRLENQASQLTDLLFAGADNTVNIDGTALQVVHKGIRLDAGASAQFNISNKGRLDGDANLGDPRSALLVALTTEAQWYGSVSTAPVAAPRSASPGSAFIRGLPTTEAAREGLRVTIHGEGTVWTGDVSMTDGYRAMVHVADQGVWVGKAAQSGTGKVDVTVGPGAGWKISGIAAVSSLTVSKTATVDSTSNQLRVGALTLEPGIAITNLSGNGNLVVDQFAAPVVFRSQAVSEAQVDTNGFYQKDGKTFILAKVADPNIRGTTELGVWQYDIKALKPAATAADYDVVLMKSQRLSRSAATALSMAAAPAIVATLASDSLDSHLTASRRSTDRKNGAWVAFLGGNTRVATRAGAAFEMKTSGVMLGGETRLSAWNGTWLLGGAVSFSLAGFNSGGTNAYSAHGYLSRRYDNGVFLDTTAQYGHYRTSAKTRATDGQPGEGRFSSNGFGIGIKLGYEWRTASGAFVEPYAKLEGKASGAAAYTLSNGMKVASDAGSSILGELGTTAGYRLTAAHGYVEPYVHLAWMNTFSNGGSVNLNNRIKLNNSTASSALRMGLGVRMQLTNNVGGYAGLTYTKGRYIEQPLQGAVGINVIW